MCPQSILDHGIPQVSIHEAIITFRVDPEQEIRWQRSAGDIPDRLRAPIFISNTYDNRQVSRLYHDCINI